MMVAVAADQDCTISVQFANSIEDANNGNIDSTITYNFIAGTSEPPHRLVAAREWFRILVENVGGSDMTYFRLQTSLGVFGQLSSPLNASVSADEDCLVVKSALIDSSGATIPSGSTLGFSTSTLLTNGQTYDSGVLSLVGYSQIQTQILSDVDGTIVVDFIRDEAGTDVLRTLTIPHTGSTDLSIFGAPAFTPYVRYRFTADEAGQSDFYFDTKFLISAISPQTLTLDAFISPLMTANISRSILVGKTSGGAYNNVAIEPVTNNLNVSLPRAAFGEVAVINPTPVVQASFVYNVNADVIKTTTTGSGTVTQSESMAVLQTTAAASSSAKIETKRFIKYRPGQGVVIRGTALFTTGAANSEQLFGAGDDADGLFFGYNGTSFGIMSRYDGTDAWIAQASWNGDLMDGTGGSSNPSGQNLDPTKGNVFQIRFQWLGFGRIEFGIEDAVTGRFVTVHSIQYANANTVPSLLNPSFPILWSVENTTNATNMTLKGASCCAEIEGQIKLLGPTNAIGNTKTAVTTTLTNIITIRNKSTFASITNRSPINILKYSLSVDGNKPAEFQLIKNTTLGGTPSYTDISTNTSVVDYDTAGTTITGGQVIDFATLAAAGSTSEVGTSTTDIVLLPGETLTLAVNATATTTDVTAAIRWVEDIV